VNRRYISAIIPSTSLLVLLFAAKVSGADNNASTVASWEPSYHQIWNSDTCAQKESWPKYWGWVHDFFLGNIFDAGWFSEMNPVFSKITDATDRQAIESEVLSLGRQIAGEWAKPNSCRKIDTGQVETWGDSLKEAADRDSGDGHEIKAQLNSLSQGVTSALAR
jgi:hypothetical protein